MSQLFRMTVERIIIVGAGMGGLAAAIACARTGYDITLLEAAPGPGGKMRTCPSAAGPVDAGPTVLTLRDVFDTLFSEAGAAIEDYVNLTPEPVLARHFWPDGSRLDLTSDARANAHAIADFAGSAAATEFRRFSARARRLFAAFEGPMMRASVPTTVSMARVVARAPCLIRAMAPGRTLAAQLARDFTDPRLRQLFGRYATYVGGSPYEVPALLSLIWQAEAGGIWRVAGGMSALASGMARLAADLGVRIRYGTPVARIARDAGTIRGVELGDGTHVACDRVVFNGDPKALHDGMLGAPVAAAVSRDEVAPRSLSAEVWAFAAEARGADLAHHNVFFGRDPRTEFDPIARRMPPEDPTIYICAQDRGTGRTPPPLERFEIIVNAAADGPSEEFSQCRQRTFSTLADRGLSLAPLPGPEALTGPRDFARLFPGSGGAIYGRSPAGMNAGLKRPTARTGIAGLYLAGGGAHPGAGVPMATLSGLHAARAIAEDRASTGRSRPTAMRGGISTESPTMAAAPSRSSGS